VRYAEGLSRMRRHGPVIAHCTDSEDFPIGPSGILGIGTLHYNWPMSAHASQAFSTSSVPTV